MTDHEKAEYWFKGTPAQFGAIADDLARKKQEADPDLVLPYKVVQDRESWVQVEIHWSSRIRHRGTSLVAWADDPEDLRPGERTAYAGSLVVTATAIPEKGTRLRRGLVHMTPDNNNPDPVLALWDELLDELDRLELIDDSMPDDKVPDGSGPMEGSTKGSGRRTLLCNE